MTEATIYIASTAANDGFSEDYTGATREAAAALLWATEGRVTAYVGRKVTYGDGEEFFPRASTIIDGMQECAFDSCEHEYWLDGLPGAQLDDLEAGVHAAIRAWIVKHKLQPEFFGVEDVRAIELPEPESEAR